MKKNSKHLLIAASLFIGSLGAVAQTPSDLKDLVDMRASSLDGEMSDRGYTFENSSKSGSDIYQNWWNSNKSKCVSTRVSDGRVQSIIGTMAYDCGKSTSSSHSKGSKDSNSSYHHGGDINNIVGMNVSNITSEMSHRGYTLHNSDQSGNTYYQNWWNNNEKKCISMRIENREVKSVMSTMPIDCGSNDTSHNNNYSNYESNKQHYTGKIEYKDLHGWKSTSAYSELESRGFHQTKEHQADGKTYRLWKDNDTNQCIKTVSINKKIDQIFASDRCY
ncbi:hypothetical protein [Formosa haliotis]|uniref:hypothetical protein n=1 Tax=Formosa haliotis TaxID=1555194 RepID=UPI000824EA96|nr:hypothetical protein [Formosa haliotis]